MLQLAKHTQRQEAERLTGNNEERLMRKLRPLVSELSTYEGDITFKEVYSCCRRSGIGIDKRTAINWLHVLLDYGILKRKFRSNPLKPIQLYERGPNFSRFCAQTEEKLRELVEII